MKKIIAAAVVILSLLGMPLMADEIRLNNGELLTGNIVGLGEDNLRMATVSGEIFIPRNKVDSAFLGWDSPCPPPKESQAIDTAPKDPPPAPDLGAMGGDFLEE